MLITLLAAMLSSQAADTIEVACTLDIKTVGSVRRQRVTEIGIGCPTDVPDAEALQEVADNTAAAISFRRIRGGGLLTASEAWFQRDASGSWTAIPGQIIISQHMGMPVQLMTDGAITQSCSWAASPASNGQALAARVTCYVDGRTRPRNSIRRAEESVEDMIRNTRFLPTDASYCFQDEVRLVTTAVDVTGGRFNNDNDHEPDMRRLPQLC